MGRGRVGSEREVEREGAGGGERKKEGDSKEIEGGREERERGGREKVGGGSDFGVAPF